MPHGRAAVLTVAAACAVLAGGVTLVVSKVGPDSAGASSASLQDQPQSLSLLSSNPAPGSVGVSPDTPVSLQFDAPLAAKVPLPSFNPPVSGTWVSTSSDDLLFQATQSLPPGDTEVLTVPGGPDGISTTDGRHLASSSIVSFTVAPMSTLRVQQLLAELGFLPLSFTPADPHVTPTEAAIPVAGSFAWRWGTLPAKFTSLWSEGQPNVITTGAVMAFESQHQLKTDGVAGAQVWNELLSAVVDSQGDSYGHYDFVEVSTSIPESVSVWRDGTVVYSTPANTGIEAAPTEIGTWPVFARYVSTTMSGTNPDGSHYDDPGVPWVSYFHGGDALHGFYRATYGVPQSLGCVEMPPSHAAVVYPYTPIGTLVTIS